MGKRYRQFRAWALVGILMLVGCMATPVSTPEHAPAIRGHLLNQDMHFGVSPWVDEVGERYDEAVVILVHGETISDTWFAFPDTGPIPVEALVAEFREQYPDERIVLITCNPDGLFLDAENVTYALELVWVIPDRFVGLGSLAARHTLHPDAIGDIWSFVEQ